MKSMIEWMAKNHVAANILLFFIIMLGVMQGRSIKQEAFPDIEVDTISVSITWQGAGPSEVSAQLCRPVEEAVTEVEGIDEITCNASDGSASISIELESDADMQTVLNDVSSAVDGISPDDFPDEAETPVVTKDVRRMELIRIVMFGDIAEKSVFEYAYRVKDDLLDVEGVNYVELEGTRTPEILIEISPETLSQHGLTLSDVSSIIEKESENYPSGSVKKGDGQILFRTVASKTSAKDFENISIKQSDNGSILYLKDIANIRQTIEESDNYTRFNGTPAVIFKVYQQDQYTPTEMAAAIKDKMEKIQLYLPDQLDLEIWRSAAKIFNSRLDLLISNALTGLALVFIILGLFLEIRLAFWVMLGIPISFVGALFFLPFVGVTINMNSMFAFILVSGIVVDDAIVIGEHIYSKREQGLGPIQAAIEGCYEMGGAVIFAVLTTMCSFAPLLFVEGFMGDFVYAIPVVVISVLAISVIESLFILPAHLSRSSQKPLTGVFRIFNVVQSISDKTLKWIIFKPFRKIVSYLLIHRYASVALAISLLLLSFGAIGGGFISMQFFPKIEDFTITATIEFPSGYSSDKTTKYVQELEDAGKTVVANADKDADNGLNSFDGMFTTVSARTRNVRSQNTTVSVELRMQELDTLRNISASELAARWREAMPQSPDIISVAFESHMMDFGDDINVTLSHYDSDQLKQAVETLKSHLGQYSGVKDITDSESEANPEYSFRITEEAKSMGLTPYLVAEQIRGAFQGLDVFSIPRETEDIDVVVIFPKKDRETLNTLNEMKISTSSGDMIPLLDAITIQEGFEPITIRRINAKRVIEVTGSFEEDLQDSDKILESIINDHLPELKGMYPGLSANTRGAHEEQEKSMQSLIIGFLTALLGIYSLLAVYFKSYTQPIIVMIAIPFGIAGAVGGHYLLGHPVSFMSMFGIIGLSGVVINDSLILVGTINSFSKKNKNIFEALLEASMKRFRPIMLTSLTTFFGLMPILMEESMDAQFLIPTAISLGIGILFTTFITLAVVPSLYYIFYDIKMLFSGETKVEKGSDQVK